ncbi:MAG: circumsporozoite protein-membrane associated protein, partial [Planctomycetota bacterium]
MSGATTIDRPTTGRVDPRSTGTAEASQYTTRSDAVAVLIDERIGAAQTAIWRAELVRRVLLGCIVSMAGLLGWIILDQWLWATTTLGRLAMALGALGSGVFYVIHRIMPVWRQRVRDDYAARALERDHPELGHALSSYVTLKATRRCEPPDSAISSRLDDRVLSSIGASAANKLRHIDGLPAEANGLMPWWLATIGLVAALAIYSVVSPKNSFTSATRLLAPLARVAPPRRVEISNVTPGDAEVLAGRTVPVSADVVGLRDGETVQLVWVSGSPGASAGSVDFNADPSASTSSAMRHEADVSIPHSARGLAEFEIRAGDASAGPFQWTIRDTPVVQVHEVHYQPPRYTQQASRTGRSGIIRGLDGTRVTLHARVNRAVEKAMIQFNPQPIGEHVRATAGTTEMEIDEDGTRLTVTFALRSRKRLRGGVELESYRIVVWDDAEQTNADPIIHPIKVIDDLPPEITIVTPQQTVKDLPMDAAQLFEIHAADVDHGLAEVELEVRRGIDVLTRLSLWKHPTGQRGNQIVEYRLRPGRLLINEGPRRRRGGLKVGDELSVVAIATDNRHDADDPSLIPNVTATKPVQLKLVVGDTDSETSGDGGGGQQGQQGDGQQGEGQQGQGQRGDGQQGEGQQGQGQRGDGQQGEGQQGQGQRGDGQQGEGQQGEGQRGDGQQGEGQQGQGQRGDGQQGEGQQGEGQRGDGQQGGGQQGEGQRGDGQQGDGQQGQGQRGDGQQGPADQSSGNAAAPQNPSDGDSQT